MLIESAYDRIIAVLGKDQDDPVFFELIKDLAEMPEIIARPYASSDYLFDRAGLTLHYMNEPKCFVAAFFHWGSADVRAGRVRRYSGDLVSELEFGETIREVEAKLDAKPARSRATEGETHNEYELGPYELHCKFDAAERMEHLSVWYTPACSWRR